MMRSIALLALLAMASSQSPTLTSSLGGGQGAGNSCWMYSGNCGSGSCVAGAGHACYDCSVREICCCSRGGDDCDMSGWRGNSGKCGDGPHCAAHAGGTCNDCSTQNHCAVCSTDVG